MILLTGGSGLLGRHLKPLLEPCWAPPHAEFDVEKLPEAPEGVSMIVHAAAYTDVQRAEVERDKAYGANVLGTLNMALLDLPLVYVSTSYVFDGGRGDYHEDDVPNPLNCYARTKELGEHMAKRALRWLIIRTLFKPRPFEHPRACTDQFSNGDYVDVIAPLIAKSVRLFEQKKIAGVLHLGTERRSTYELARETRDVEPITRENLCIKLPRDVTLSLSRWRQLAT